MKPTQKNLHGKRMMEQHAASALTGRRVELTTTGKVHDRMGKLAEFTSLDAAKEVLTGLGYFPTGKVICSFTEYARQVVIPASNETETQKEERIGRAFGIIA